MQTTSTDYGHSIAVSQVNSDQIEISNCKFNNYGNGVSFYNILLNVLKLQFLF